MNLTAAQVRALTSEGWHRCARQLYLRVRSDSRVWYFRWQRDKRPKWVMVGNAEFMTLATAKAQVFKMRAAVADGRPPKQSTPRGVPSFRELTSAYVKAHEKAWRGRGVPNAWITSVATHARPLSNLPVDAITAEDVQKAIRKVWIEQPATAKKVRSRIERILDYARVLGHRSGPNAATWKGQLSHMLPPLDIATQKHHTAEPVKSIPSLAADLAELMSISAKAVLYTLLCMVRSGDTRGALWTDIDVELACWTIPEGKGKSGRGFKVPLSNHALALLASLPRKGAYVFPGMRGPLSDTALLMVMRRLRGMGSTVHGLRSSAKDFARLRGFSEEVSELALDHVVGSATRNAYARDTLFSARRDLLTAWADYAMGTEPPKMIRVGEGLRAASLLKRR